MKKRFYIGGEIMANIKMEGIVKYLSSEMRRVNEGKMKCL